MRFTKERADPANAGFKKAFELFDKIKAEIPQESKVSFADLYILGGYTAIEVTGGPLRIWKSRLHSPRGNRYVWSNWLPVRRWEA